VRHRHLALFAGLALLLVTWHRIAPLQESIRTHNSLSVDQSPSLFAAVDPSDDPLPPGAVARLGSSRLRHLDSVSALAFSPDSKVLASGGSRHVRLWQTTTGKELRRWRLKGAAEAIAFSPDGKLLAVAGHEWGVMLLDPGSGRRLDQFGHLGHAGQKASISFSPDGKVLAVRTEREVFYWDVATGTPLRQRAGRREPPPVAGATSGQAVLSPDGKVRALGNERGRIRLVDVRTGRELQLGGLSAETPIVCLSRDGKVAATLGDDHTIRLWEIPSGRLLRLVGRGSCSDSLAFSPDGALLASRDHRWHDRHKHISIHDARAGRFLRNCGNFPNWAYSPLLGFSADSRLLADSDGTTARLWDVAADRQVHHLTGHNREVTCGSFSPDDKVLVTAGLDGTVRVWSVETGKELRRLAAHAGKEVWQVAFSANSAVLATAGSNNFVCLYDTATWALRRRIVKESPCSFFVALSPDGKTLASDSDDGTVSLWDVGSGKARGPFPGHQARITSGAFTADGKYLVTASKDGTALVWDLAALRPVPAPTRETRTDSSGDPLPEGATARLGSLPFDARKHAAFSPDGKLVAVATWGFFEAVVTGDFRETGVLLLDAATGREIRRIGPSIYSTRVAFSPDGKFLAAADHDVYLLSLNGEKLDHFLGHSGVSCLTFSPDGKVLAVGGPTWSGGDDRTILLWDVAGRRPLRRLAGHAASVDSLAFSHDGKVVASSSRGEVRFWSVATGKVARLFTLGKSVQLANGLKVLAFAEEDGVCLYDLAREKVVGRAPGQYESWLLGPDGRRAVLSVKDGPAALWDLGTGKEVRRLQDISEAFDPVCFSPDGRRLLCRGGLWDLTTGQKVRRGGGHQSTVSCLAWTSDAQVLISGSADRSVRQWEMKTGKELPCCTGHASAVTALALAPDDKAIASGNAGGAVHVHDRATGKRLFSFQNRPVDGSWKDEVASLVFADGGKRLIAGDRDGRIRQWSLASGRRLADLPGYQEGGAGLALSSDGRTLASVGRVASHDLHRGDSSLIRLHDLRRRREIGTITGKHETYWCIALSPDGKFLAASRSVIESFHGHHLHHQIVLFEVATRREVLRFDTGVELCSLHFSPDGRTVLGVSRKWGRWPPRSVHVLDVSIGREVFHLSRQAGKLSVVAPSPDGAALALGNSDGTVLLRQWAWPAPWRPWQPFHLDSEQQQKAWADLASLDAARAYRAAELLLRDPARAVALVRQRLGRAEQKVDPRLIARLVADLDSDDFAVREKARLGLEQQGELAEHALDRALGERPSLEARIRIDRLLRRLERAGPSPERLRVLRAIAVLERMGTRQAQELLRWLAEGAPEAFQTQEALAAVRRLGRRPGVVPRR
jgi:WD40 repeat protein